MSHSGQKSKVSRLLRMARTWDSPNPGKSINQHRFFGITYRSYRDLYHIQSSKSILKYEATRKTFMYTHKKTISKCHHEIF